MAGGNHCLNERTISVNYLGTRIIGTSLDMTSREIQCSSRRRKQSSLARACCCLLASLFPPCLFLF